MLRRSKKHQKKLAKLVLAALLFTGAVHGLMNPSVAAAADPVTVTGYSSNSGFAPDPSMMKKYSYDSYYYYAYAPTDGTVTILNLAQGTVEGAWSDPKFVTGHYGSGASGASGVTVNMTGADVVVSNLYGGLATGSGSTSTGLGTASENTVNISTGKVSSYVAGGYSRTTATAAQYYFYYGGNADENTVTISGDAEVGEVAGGLSDYGGANNNKVFIKDNAVTKSVSGGETEYYYVVNADVSGNTVTISGNAVVGGTVHGGYSAAEPYYSETLDTSANANGNTVIISEKAAVSGSVYGGYTYGYYAKEANANGNMVTISGDAAVGGGVTGGETYSTYYYDSDSGSYVGGSANNNTVTISGNNTVGDSVYGGISGYGSADSNKVIISGETAISGKPAEYGYVMANIYGGSSYHGSANSNTVTISESVDVGLNTYQVNIRGGSSYGSADSNTVTISDNVTIGEKSSDYGSVYVYGGYSQKSSANSNEVTVSDNVVVGSNSSKYVSVYIYGGYGGNGDTNNNTVTISDDAVVGSNSSVSVYGGHSYYGSADNNTVIIRDNTIVGSNYASVYGGYGSSTANDNTVTISGKAAVGSEGTANITGGFAYAYGVEGGGVSNNTVTISGEAVVGSGTIYGGYTSYGSADENTVTISKKAAVGGTSNESNETIYGGRSDYGSADNNTVTISDDAAVTINKNTATSASSSESRIYIYGGNSSSGSADKNEIAVSDNAVVGPDATRLYIFGGFSQNKTATTNENKVTISDNATVGANASYVSIFGGGGVTETTYYYYVSYTFSAAAANDNTVTISESAAVGANSSNSNVFVYGGHSNSSSANNNTVTVSDNAVVGNAYAYVYGGFAGGDSSSGSASTVSSRTADNNTVTISNNAVVGGGYGASIYGGESYSSSANNNTVTISDSAVVGSEYAYIMGAYGSSTANDNTVTISGNAAVAAGSETHASSVSILGAYASAYGIEEGGASNNAVTIRDDAAVGSYAYSVSINGAESYYGIVSNNTVTISDDAVVATHSGTDSYYSMQIMGGQSYYGIAENNTVTISGGTVGDADNYKNSRITGGSSYVEATGNTVTIEGDTTTVYAGAVVGGYSQYTENTSANTTDNIVTINAKEVEIGLVYGGRTDKGNASENTVTITNGSVTGKVSSPGYYYGTAAVAGGYVVKNGDATSNIVELNGVTVSVPENDGSGGSPVSLLSSSASSPVSITLAVIGGYSGTGNATDNTVKLQDTIISGGVYGGAGDSPSDTGGSSTRDLVTGNTLILGGINTVKGEVTNFETIKLADTVEWGSGTTVLKADQFTDNADGTRASLDVKDAEANLAAATSGQMKLLASDTANDFKTLSLVYSGGTESLSETNPYKVMKSDAETTETTPVNGVTLTSASTHLVSLDKDNDYKNVLYKIENLASKVTLGEMTWGTGRDLDGGYAFVNTATVDASNLSFTGTAATLLKKDDVMTLVSGATGISSIPAANITQPDNGKGTVAVEYTDSNNIKFNATANGTVGVKDTDVKYTVSSVTADKITLGSQAWGTTADLPDSSWTASESTEIDATNFAYTGKATTALEAGEVGATVLNAKGLTTASPVTSGTDKDVAVNYTDDAGVNYVATASGHVAAATDAVNYVVDSVEVTGGVGLQNWKGEKNKVSDVTSLGWTGTSVAVTTGTFTAPGDMELGDTRTIATAATGFFGTVSGSNAFPSNGGTLSEDTGGVKLAGSMIGGVKAEDEGAKLTYYAMKKTADTLTLGTFEFVNGAGNARKYGREYDLTNADITTDGLSFTDASKKKMEAGNKMTLVDASGAYKNGTAALKTLDAGVKTSFDVDFSDDVAVTDQANITFTGQHTDTLAMVDSQKLEYTVGDKVVGNAALDGTVDWVDDGTHYTNTKYTFDGNSKVDIKEVKFTSTTNPLNQSMTLIKNAAGVVATNVSGTPDFTVALNNTTLTATAAGTASMDSSDLKYTVNNVTLETVTVNSTGNDAVPDGWATAANVAVDTEKMEVPADVSYGKPQRIMTAGSAIFSDENITGKNKYGETPATFTDKDNKNNPAVTVSGRQDKGVKASADGKSLVYEVGKKEASSIKLGKVKWAAGKEVMDGSSEEYNYEAITSLGTDNFDVTYDAPEKVDAGKGEPMTLLKANETLADMAEEVKKEHAYQYNPVSGVQVKATITGNLAVKDGIVTYTPAENRASKLIFGDVEWKDSGALMTRPSNIIFAGADVDTTKIKFTNVIYLDADQQMTLVSDFGKSVGTITGDKYMVGTAFEGEGAASLKNGDLIFRTKTSAGVSEQTHKAVMGVEATMALMASGREHEDKVIEGLGNDANAGTDGAYVAASFGGGSSRYETGSHVSTRNWNAAVGVGAKKETEKGTLQYGIFGEYGKGSYTLHSDAGKSEGDAHYAGGGILAKWTNKHDVYAEVSFRLGRVSDNANDLLRDGAGNAYGYDIDANYFGAHVGVGKVFNYKGGKSLDVYGKYFYTRRDGAEFDAVQHYNLDSVSSSVLRIGARYGSNDRKWNWYGGLAYEYEFDGEAKGTVNGTAIRAASIKGSSVRGEIGLRMNATKTNPWQTDISIYGYGGKHRGFGGNVNVAYTF